MSKVVGSITYTPVPGFPAGTSIDHIEVTISGGAQPVSQDVAPDTASVNVDLADGSYTYSIEAVTADNSALGSPVTGTFTVATGTGGGTVTLNLPSGASFTQSA